MPSVARRIQADLEGERLDDEGNTLVRQAILADTVSRSVPLMAEKGDVIEWFGAASNVTARKETMLQAQFARLRWGGNVSLRAGITS